VTARRPTAGSTCSAAILYERRVVDRQRAGAESRAVILGNCILVLRVLVLKVWVLDTALADSNVHCSACNDDDAILAHSRYADGNYDSALNSSLHRASIIIIIIIIIALAMQMHTTASLLWISSISVCLGRVFRHLLPLCPTCCSHVVHHGVTI